MLYIISYMESSPFVSVSRKHREKNRNKNVARDEKIQYGRIKPARHFSSIRTNFSLRNNTCRLSKSPQRQTTVFFKAFRFCSGFLCRTRDQNSKQVYLLQREHKDSAANRVIRARISYAWKRNCTANNENVGTRVFDPAARVPIISLPFR